MWEESHNQNFHMKLIIDKATARNWRLSVPETESAQGVSKAFDDNCKFFGHTPEAILHGKKQIHDDRKIRGHVENK